jgi:hypothetical protein
VLRASSLRLRVSECLETLRNLLIRRPNQARLGGAPMQPVAEGLRVLLVALLISTAGLACAQDVTTWHYDNSRSGVQSVETVLTPANVTSSTFGKVFSFPVSGAVYAQPLYLSQYQMNDGQLHNVLLVATAEDYVYAFDADGNNPAQGYLWRQSMLGSGETWVSYTDVNVVDIKPNIGIIGTPVVDRAGGTIYVVAKSKTTSSTPTFYQRLHALNVADGTEKLNGPTVIQATVNGTGDGGTTVSFSPLLNNQRASLLLAPTPGVGSGNSVFIAWASHGDLGVYHGWIMAYDAANIATQNAAWCSTPNGQDVNKGGKGGIWMSGGGLSSDDNGNVFAGIANGTFDADSNGIDYGDSAVEMTLTSSGLAVEDYFTPGDQSTLEESDKDMGMSAVTLLPPQTGPVANLMVTSDKSGTIYLINRDKMGGYTTPDDSSLQDFSNGGDFIHGGFVFFNNTIYSGPDRAALEAFTLNTGTGLLSTTPQSVTTTVFGCSTCYVSGPTPSISANGTANAIVWALDNSNYNNDPSILHAYNAANLATEYYNSAQAANNRDASFIAVKFTTPTIASGRVYVGGQDGVAVYGLLSSNISPAATPQFSVATGTYTSVQSVQITDATSGSTIYYTTNGTKPTTSSAVYSGAIPVNATETIEAIAVAQGYSVSAVASATYTLNLPAAATPTFSVTPGTYTSIQSVTISDTTSGATIYYTTNGKTPTTSSPVASGAISVSSTETIEAIAAATGYSNSPVGSAAYTINLPAAATPTFSVTPGTYASPQSVMISDTTSGATIYYTTNGKAPTTSSPVASGAISVGSTETIEAIAAATGYSNSAVASAAYTITMPAAATPKFSLAAGIYTEAKSVTISDTTSGAAIYYTTNSTTPTISSTKYKSAITVSATETIEAIAVATGHSSSAVASAAYTIDLPATAAPKFSLAAGTYTGTQSVTISDATSGAAICYTTNGTTPTTSSTKYTKAISVSSTETIQAIAFASGHAESAVASEAYTIEAQSPNTKVSLTSVANLIGIYSDGTKFSAEAGFNGAGSAYSSKLLGRSLTYAGVTYAIGAPNVKNVVKGAGAPVIPLPAGKYIAIEFLAAAVIGNQPSVTFTVTYTDGSKTKFTQGISDWITPQHYSGESIALASTYSDTSSGGRSIHTYNVYQYSLTLNSAKTVKSLTMPANSDVELIAVTLQ